MRTTDATAPVVPRREAAVVTTRCAPHTDRTGVFALGGRDGARGFRRENGGDTLDSIGSNRAKKLRVTGETLVQRLWAAAQTDAGLLTRLRVSYRGRFDVLDALWWRANPLTPTPAGAPDPASGLAALQAAVYSPAAASEPLVEFVDPITGEPVHATENEHRLRELMQQLNRDAAALDFTLERLSDWTHEGSFSGDRPDREPRPETDPRPDPPVAPAPVADRRRTPLLVLVGFAAGVATGAVAAMATMDPRGTRAAPGPAASQATASVASRDFLKIFRQPAEFPGGKVPDLGPEYVQDSIRRIPDPAPAAAGYEVFVARRSGDRANVERPGLGRPGVGRPGADRYCIILRHPDEETGIACADRSSIAATGLRLDAVLLGKPPTLEAPESPYIVDVTVIWASDGTLTADFVPRAQLPR
jgi:hypothetical protein